MKPGKRINTNRHMSFHKKILQKINNFIFKCHRCICPQKAILIPPIVYPKRMQSATKTSFENYMKFFTNIVDTLGGINANIMCSTSNIGTHTVHRIQISASSFWKRF